MNTKTHFVAYSDEWRWFPLTDDVPWHVQDFQAIEIRDRLFQAICSQAHSNGLLPLDSLVHFALDDLIYPILHPDDRARYRNGETTPNMHPDTDFRFGIREEVMGAIYELVEDGRIEWITFAGMPAIYVADAVLHARGKEAEQRRLSELASMPYAEYLRTPEWQERRARHIEHAGNACQVCNRRGSLHVHHRTYERRGRERFSDLVVLCAACHKTFHENLRIARPGKRA